MRVLADYFGYGVLKIVTFLVQRLPFRAALGLGGWLGRTVFYFSKRRYVAFTDVRSALPEISEQEAWRIVRENYRHFGKMFIEVLYLPKIKKNDIPRWVHTPNRERYDEAHHSGRGTIFLTAHFGNWEWLPAISAYLGKAIRILAREQKHSMLNDYLNRLRQSHGTVPVPRGMGLRGLMRALKNKDMIGISGDQDAKKNEGIILPLFGRKTTLALGSFKAAQRMGARIVPVFLIRMPDDTHTIYFEPEIVFDGGLSEDAANEKAAKEYVAILERYIRKYPSQWLWGAKRWKYTWTKRLLVLTDGKKGHETQSMAVVRHFQNIKEQYGRPGVECPAQVCQVRFKNPLCRILFPWAAFFMGWQKRKAGWMRHFMTPESFAGLKNQNADFVISAGSSLTALNRLWARYLRAKSVILMKPSFPDSLFGYDLCVLPEHDGGKTPRNGLRVLLPPSDKNPDELKDQAQRFRQSLGHPEQVKIGVLLGGDTRGFRIGVDDIKAVLEVLERAGESTGRYVLTTSRRTSPDVENYLRKNRGKLKFCEALIIANEDARTEVVPGILGLSEILLVTEDSVSMIAEAVRSLKKVFILTFHARGPSRKHERFKRKLVEAKAVRETGVSDLLHHLSSQEPNLAADMLLWQETALKEQVRRIL